MEIYCHSASSSQVEQLCLKQTAGEASIMHVFLTYWVEEPHLFCASYTDRLQGDTRSV